MRTTSVAPKARGGATSSLMVYVPDVDSAYKRAIDAGGKQERPVENQFWGDRMGTFADPFGHNWMLATHVEDISEAEMKKRMDAMAREMA